MKIVRVRRFAISIAVASVFAATAMVVQIPLSAAAFSAAPPAGEMRAVWAHPGSYSPEPAAARAKMSSDLDAYVRAGIDTVILLVKTTSGLVYYPSEIAARDTAYSQYDFLGLYLEEARKRKITVHPWFCVFHEEAVAGPVRQHPEWLIHSPDNEMVGCVNPALPEVRAYELSLLLEVVKKYGVDWVHLDYIRFPSSPREVYFSWDPQTRALFKQHSGMDPKDMKARDSGNMMWDEWIEWNASQVTAFVRELRSALKSVGRPVRISAAVFPVADEARVLIGQDWGGWLGEGLLDMVCPMLYTNHLPFFEKYVQRAVDAGRGKALVLPGIGISTSHNQNTPEIMMEEIGVARRLGADGVVFFSSSSLTPGFMEKLEQNPKK